MPGESYIDVVGRPTGAEQSRLYTVSRFPERCSAKRAAIDHSTRDRRPSERWSVRHFQDELERIDLMRLAQLKEGKVILAHIERRPLLRTGGDDDGTARRTI